MISNKFHKAFKLQGKSFHSVEELLDFSLSISAEIHFFLKQWFSESSFVEVKTSGSTGTPKVIQLQKSHMINSAKATGDFFNLVEGTTALLCMSSNFIAGKMMLVRALELGWELDSVIPVSNPLKDISKKYDFSAMVPIQLHNSLNELHKIKKIIVGGGVVSDKLLKEIQQVKTAIFATYGMTETVTHIAVKKLNCHSEINEESYYKTLPNISISKDLRGCLVIDAPKISEDTVVTNDLVQLISAFQFEWLGRYDTVINSGGVKLVPEQIEQKISKIIHQRFFVCGLSDTVLGEKLVLIIEGSKENRVLNDINNLKSLSKFEKPKEIFFISKFIETETKKINRVKTIDILVVN